MRTTLRRRVMRRGLILLVLVATLIFAWSQNSLSASRELISLLGLRVGSSGHMFTSKITEVINTNVPEVQATAMTGASQENPVNVQKKRAQIGFTTADYAKKAYNGEDVYKATPCKDIRDMFFFVITLDTWLVRADSDIKRIDQLKDKKVCVGPKGYGLSEHALVTLKAHGLTPETMRKEGGNVIYAEGNDCARMIQDKLVDAIFAHSGKSSLIAYNLPAEQSVGLKPLHFDDTKLKEISKILGDDVANMEIDGGVYKAEAKPVKTFGTPHIFVVHKDVSEDLVYKMTKAIWQNQKEILKTVGPFYNPFKIENALVGATIPVHPGALKYYKEVGIAK
jgi:uncharacterized protein